MSPFGFVIGNNVTTATAMGLQVGPREKENSSNNLQTFNSDAGTSTPNRIPCRRFNRQVMNQPTGNSSSLIMSLPVLPMGPLHTVTHVVPSNVTQLAGVPRAAILYKPVSNVQLSVDSKRIGLTGCPAM